MIKTVYGWDDVTEEQHELSGGRFLPSARLGFKLAVPPEDRAERTATKLEAIANVYGTDRLCTLMQNWGIVRRERTSLDEANPSASSPSIRFRPDYKRKTEWVAYAHQYREAFLLTGAPMPTGGVMHDMEGVFSDKMSGNTYTERFATAEAFLNDIGYSPLREMGPGGNWIRTDLLRQENWSSTEDVWADVPMPAAYTANPDEVLAYADMLAPLGRPLMPWVTCPGHRKSTGEILTEDIIRKTLLNWQLKGVEVIYCWWDPGQGASEMYDRDAFARIVSEVADQAAPPPTGSKNAEVKFKIPTIEINGHGGQFDVYTVRVLNAESVQISVNDSPPTEIGIDNPPQ